MKIAILSDIHDHIWNLDKVLTKVKDKVKAIIFCGDMCAPFTAGNLAKAGVPTYVCLGNGDEDQIGSLQRALEVIKISGGKMHWIPLTEEFGKVVVDGKKIAFCHYPKLGELLAKTGDYDAVFHGHTHVSKSETFGKTLLVNPGAVCGIQKGQPGIASYSIYDTTTHTSKIIEI